MPRVSSTLIIWWFPFHQSAVTLTLMIKKVLKKKARNECYFFLHHERSFVRRQTPARGLEELLFFKHNDELSVIMKAYKTVEHIRFCFSVS